MPIANWKDEICNAAAQWPCAFRARLSEGNWHLLGVSENVRQEFRQWAERMAYELKFPRGDVDATTALLYRLKANGHNVCSKQIRKARETSESLQQRFTIHPLREALIQYVRAGFGKNPEPATNARLKSSKSWQIIAVTENRVRRERLAIITALQGLGSLSEAPTRVREFYSSLRKQPDFRQPISPPPLQLPNFDRLNQSPEEWRKISRKVFEQHCDEFLRQRQFWVDAGVDDEMPAAKSTRGAGPLGVHGKRRNTAVKLRYHWAAQYLCHMPLKEIASQSGANPITVGRIARAILEQAEWLKPRRPRAD